MEDLRITSKTIYDAIAEKLGPLEVAAHLTVLYDGLCDLCPIYGNETYKCPAYWERGKKKELMCFAILKEWLTEENEQAEKIAEELIYAPLADIMGCIDGSENNAVIKS